MALTPAQLTLLRDRHPHFASMYLSVFAADTDTVTAAGSPGIVYAGTVNGAHNRGARDITCANLGVPVGNIANVDPGQTVLVGTAMGDDSISKRRLRRRNGQVLTLDANGVVWTAGDFITVIENYEFWPVYPKIDDTTPFAMYKDDNITYDLATYTDFDATDANEDPSPVAIMGPPWAGWITGGSVTVSLEGGDSYAVAPGATISSYAWATTGGAIANAAVASTTITFTTCGVYWITLTVTDSNAITQRTHRPFFVHDTSTCPPFYDFTADLHLTHDQGNDLRISALRNVDFDEIPDEALVVLWGDEYFRDAGNPPAWTAASIGGYTGREHVKFVGYLDRESIESDPEDAGALTFEAYSINRIMNDTTMWGIALNDQAAAPSTWYQYQNINTARAIHHLWRWHSTLFLIADVRLPLDVNLPSPGPPDNDTLTCHGLRRFAMDFAEGDLITQARIAAWDQGIYAQIGCDKQGVLHVQVDPLMIAEGAAHTDERGVVDEVQTITDEDWYEEIEFIRNERFRIAWATMSGLNWDGAVKTPLIAVMPGEDPTGAADYDSTPEVSGGIQEDGNKLLEDQADANEKVGLVWARGSNDLSEIRTPELAGNYSHVDVYPQAFYDIEYPPNKRGLDTTSSRRGVPRQVTINFNGENGQVSVAAVFEPETIDVVDGVPGKYPTTLPDPAPVAAPKYNEIEDAGRTLYGVHYGAGIYWSRDAGVTWAQRIGGRAGAQLNSRYGYTDPWGPNRLKQGSYDPETAILWDGGLGYIYRSTDAGRHWTNITPANDPPNAWNDSPAPTASTVYYEMGCADWHVNKQHYWIAWFQNGSSQFRGWLLHTDDDGISWTWYAMGSDNLTAATWCYADACVAPSNSWLWQDCGPSGAPVRTLINQDNILSDDGAAGGAQINYTNRGDNEALFTRYLLLDFGGWFVLNAATVDGGVNMEAELQTSTDTMTITVPANVDIRVSLNQMNWGDCDDDQIASLFYDGTALGYPPATPAVDSRSLTYSTYCRYAWIHVEATVAARYRGTGAGQHLFDYVRVYPHAINDEVMPTSIDIDKETGRLLYVSTWEGNVVRVRVYDTQNSLQFPACITRVSDYQDVRTDLTSRNRWIAVKSPYDPAWADYGEKFLAYGQWQGGPGPTYDQTFSAYITSNMYWTFDAAYTDLGQGSGFWVGAVEWPDQNNIGVWLNDNTPNDPEYWDTSNYGGAWNNRSSDPFGGGANRRVEFGSTRHNGAGGDNTIAAGDGSDNECSKQASPYTSTPWTSIDPGGAGTRVGAMHWVYNETP